ncbi:MAG: glycosyltransferase family 4 protein [Bacteroidales bacterium]|nr:glycosyltransferase family 4 protein [Bacteroidales bacterium]
MKILQICTKIPYPPLDGGSIAIVNLAQGFVNAGHKVDILAMNTPKHYQKEILQQIQADLRLFYVDVDTDIKIPKLFFNLILSRLPYNATRFISEKFEKQLITLIKDESYDVIQLEGLYLLPYVKVIRNICNAIIAYRAHNIEYEIWERSLSMASGIKKMYLKNLVKRLKRFETGHINTYDVLVPITRRDLSTFNLMQNKMPAFVSPTGFNMDKLFHDNISEEFPSSFFLGALDWFPNQEGLIWFINKVWRKIHSQNPNIQFYIAGRNAPLWLENKLKQPGIIYLGEIEDAHVFMLSKGIMIVPLFSGSGMRIKIIEGMALGKTIIASPVAAEGIDITHNENIIIADGEEDFINAIDNLLKNKQLYDMIGKNAQKFITENYDNKTISSSLAEFYKSQIK